MPPPLALALSLLATQVAVEGEPALVAPIAVRLLDEGYRVVPSAADALVRLEVARQDGGDVVLTAVPASGGSERERIRAGARALVALEVSQRAALLLTEVGAERDPDTDGLPGGVVLEVQGASSPVARAKLRSRLVAALLAKGYALVERGREGDRLACVYVEDGGATLTITREGSCARAIEGRTRLATAADLTHALAVEERASAPRDDAPRGHPFLGRKAPPQPALWTPLSLTREPRFSVGLETTTMLVPMIGVGPRAQLLLPLRRPLLLLVSASLHGMVVPTAHPAVLLGGSLGAGPAVEVALLPWVALRGGVQASLDAVGGASWESSRPFAAVGPSLSLTAAASWHPFAGITAELGGVAGLTFAGVSESSFLLPRLGVSLSVGWDGSGNFLAPRG